MGCFRLFVKIYVGISVLPFIVVTMITMIAESSDVVIPAD